jgi:hypothetical protein
MVVAGREQGHAARGILASPRRLFGNSFLARAVCAATIFRVAVKPSREKYGEAQWPFAILREVGSCIVTDQPQRETCRKPSSTRNNFAGLPTA